ncbi:Protein N-terminal and lysine N-methyltransferase efm7 [Polyrhizophydium stewartii]|uniref:Protein N-terminal and lysine N-methyltransferase efm7 n=1 Tax=Polyrhizophydium stewartii TaxID=2732419 RepID=A0ABR4NK42_9FUNG|nr:nicotinamide n-methyltransferase [Polyrhizophydium stewartii]
MCSINTQGFIWGDDKKDILAHLSADGSKKFDLILLADLIFNHSQHQQLLKTCRDVLAPGGVVYTTFTHHVVKWAYRDMRFFDIATEQGFKFEKMYEERWQCMFPEDEGDVDVRSTVHAYKLWIE